MITPGEIQDLDTACRVALNKRAQAVRPSSPVTIWTDDDGQVIITLSGAAASQPSREAWIRACDRRRGRNVLTTNTSIGTLRFRPAPRQHRRGQ